ncbi:unnamed protein product [Ceutorhynchus assimilis]|uniref:Succinate dehydrogenase assembly factor 3 n=1 Tax=Ceutorhynchus assimilis TaxID=467358 RepID=A0A9N9MKH5_9CUCU|nr:unnamed protein product [Ceutorhynchus assimilis]
MSHIQRVKTLYKLILKLHKGLPQEFQIIGTNYTRDEFRRHKTCTPPEANIFMNEWTNYAITLAKQLGVKNETDKTKFGDELPTEILENLRDEQIVQLYELMEAAKAPKNFRVDQKS